MSKKFDFSIFFMIFQLITTDFCQISQNSILRCRLCTINWFCNQRVFLYWFGAKCLWLEGACLLQNKKTYFYMENIMYPDINILQYLNQATNSALVWMTLLMFYISMRKMVLLICKICRMLSFSALCNISG